MRTRPRLRSAVLFDLALAVVFGLVAIGVAIAEDRADTVMASAHSVASRIGWRESYETGLLIGLGIAAIALAAVVTVVIAVRHRAKPGSEAS